MCVREREYRNNNENWLFSLFLWLWLWAISAHHGVLLLRKPFVCTTLFIFGVLELGRSNYCCLLLVSFSILLFMKPTISVE
jgi:hypothetical protein